MYICTYFWALYSGESYMDVTLRLEPIILDIERTREPILIVGKYFTVWFCRVSTSSTHHTLSQLIFPRPPRHS